MTATVPPLAGHVLLLFLLQVGLLLAAAVMLGRLAVRFGWPAVAGELCAGVLLGPSILGQFAPGAMEWLFPRDAGQFHLLDAVGQLGVLLLVGITGAQMDLGLVRRRGRTAAYVSAASLVIPLGLGIGVGLLLPASFHGPEGDRTVFALFLGVALCVSAIPVIAKTLSDMNLLHRNTGQLTLAAATVDDIAGWLLLSVVSAMAASGAGAGRTAVSAACVVVVALTAWLVVRPVARVTLARADRANEPPLATAVIVMLMVLAAAGTHAVGLEAVFGVFVCGMAIRASGAARPELLAPLRTVVLGVLAPVFFAAAGLRIDLSALASPAAAGWAALVLLLAIVGKFAGAYLGARLARLNRWEAIALGAGLNARGVIEIVIATVGLRIGVLSSRMYTIIVLVAVVTSLMAPPVLRWTMRRVEHTAEEEMRAREFGLSREPTP
ncbi:cation:proton antiporter [Actinocorallia sp. A-T 12471]|uniref:cation:proton antiporter n=1 Tax=Actinocorallia sp. A-T 12471 TaxID=3089813 RepID=UPI0029CFD38C|nr:cation:proton antiporter [Actinocorallia sp. A-T 12471]MDX6742367.1 cation:proton antiporter [Actinocorallia sp. A-T 12471]